MSSNVDSPTSSQNLIEGQSPTTQPSGATLPSASQFLLQHNVKEMLNEAVLALLRERSNDPQAFLHKFFAPKQTQAVLGSDGQPPSPCDVPNDTLKSNIKPKPLDPLNTSIDQTNTNTDVATPSRPPFIQVTESDSVVPSAAVSPSIAATVVPRHLRQVSLSVREEGTGPLHDGTSLGLSVSMPAHRSKSIAMSSVNSAAAMLRQLDDDVINNRYDGLLSEVRGGVCAQRRREVPGVLPLNIGARGSALKAPVGSSPDTVLECSSFQHILTMITGLVNEKVHQLQEADTRRAPLSNEEDMLLDGAGNAEAASVSTDHPITYGIPKLLLHYAVAAINRKDQTSLEKKSVLSTSQSPLKSFGSRTATLLANLITGNHAKHTFIAFLSHVLRLLTANFTAAAGEILGDLKEPLFTPPHGTPSPEEVIGRTPPAQSLTIEHHPLLSDTSRMLCDLMERLACLDPDGWLPDSEWVAIGSLFLFTYDESHSPAALMAMRNGSPMALSDDAFQSAFATPVWFLAGAGHPLQRRLSNDLSVALETRYREPLSLNTFLCSPLLQLGSRADTQEAELFLKARTLIAMGDKVDERRATAAAGDISLENTQNLPQQQISPTPSHKHTRNVSEDAAPNSHSTHPIEVIASVWETISNYRSSNQLPAIGIETFIGVEHVQFESKAETSVFGSSPSDGAASDPASPLYNPSQALRRYLQGCSQREQIEFLQILLTSEELKVGDEAYVLSCDPQGVRLGRWISPNQRPDGWRGGMRSIGRILVHTNQRVDKPLTYRQLLERALTIRYGGTRNGHDTKNKGMTSTSHTKPTATESFLVEALQNSLRFMATDPVQSGPQQRVYGIGRGSHTFVQRAGGGRYGKGTVVLHKLISSASFNTQCKNSQLYTPGKVVYFPGPVLGTASGAVKGWTKAQIAVAEARAGNTHEPIRLPKHDEGCCALEGGDDEDVECEPSPPSTSLIFTIHSTSALLLGNYCHLPRAHDCILAPAAPLSVRDQRTEAENGDPWLQATLSNPQQTDFSVSGLRHTPSGGRSQFLGLSSINTPHQGNTPTIPHTFSIGGASPVIRLVEMEDRAALAWHLKSQLRACPSSQATSLVWQLLHGRVALEMKGGHNSAFPNWVLKHNSNETPFEEALLVWSLTANMEASAVAWDDFVDKSTSGTASSSPPSITDSTLDCSTKGLHIVPPSIRELVEVFKRDGLSSNSPNDRFVIGSFMFFLHPLELKAALNTLDAKAITRYVWLDANTKKGQLVTCQGGGVSEEPISVRKSLSHPLLRSSQVTDADISFLCDHIMSVSIPAASITVSNSATVTDAACEELIAALCEDSNVSQISLLGCRVSEQIQGEVDALAGALRSSSRGEVKINDVDEWLQRWKWSAKRNHDALLLSSPISPRAVGTFETNVVEPIAANIETALTALSRVLSKVPLYMNHLVIHHSEKVLFDVLCEHVFRQSAQWRGIESLELSAIATADATHPLEGAKSNSSFGSNALEHSVLPTSTAWMSFLSTAPSLRTIIFKSIEPFPVHVIGSLCAAWRRRELEAEAEGKEVLTPAEESEMETMASDGLTFSRSNLHHIVFIDCELPLEIVAYLASSIGPLTSSAIETGASTDEGGDSPWRSPTRGARWKQYSSILFENCYFAVPPQFAASLNVSPSPAPTPTHGYPTNTAPPSVASLGAGVDASGSIPLSVVALTEGVASSLGAFMGGQIATSFSSGLGTGGSTALDFLNPYLERFFTLGVRLEFRGCEGVPDTIVDGRGQ